MPVRASRTQAAVLDPAAGRQRITIGRAEPPEPLREHVDYLWWVSWRCPTAYRSAVIPRPVVHVSAELHAGEPRLLVHGVHSHGFSRVLEGDGRTVAAAFRPAGFRPLLDQPVSALRDREVLASELFDADDRGIANTLLDPQLPLEDAAQLLADWLLDRTPDHDPLALELAELVERADADHDVTRADQLAEIAGVSLRTLQRQFSDYVGIGPKWVVQRSRLLDVAAAAHAGQPVDWAAEAARLGYADQPHLIRTFTALVGEPPATYAARQSADQPG